MNSITPVVKHLLVINVLMFIGTLWMGDDRLMLAAFYPTSDLFRPYQLITYMFMHANMGHIFFNMFGLYMFGPPLEVVWGPKKFLLYYFVTGFGALGLHFLVKYIDLHYMGGAASSINIPVLGASGSIFGVLTGFGMLFPNQRLMLLFPPIPIKAGLLVILYAGLELFLGLGNFESGIAHFAHLGGALSGFLLILYWQGFRLR
ncbi:MAG: rhomboid family intramembrane serine protease [Saprospiraceae bacterium]|nr:rhomboid family intramembrane serine protease [Saprospiraceae bacterium]